jgi:hypothetical protein
VPASSSTKSHLDRVCGTLGPIRELWVIRTQSALGIKDFRSVLLGMLPDVMAPPIDHAEAV